jgi:hypothetical protein
MVGYKFIAVNVTDSREDALQRLKGKMSSPAQLADVFDYNIPEFKVPFFFDNVELV